MKFQKCIRNQDSYQNIDKIQNFLEHKYKSKYESEAYDIIKADDSIKLAGL